VPTNGSIDINVVANDTDVDNNLDPSTVTITQEPSHGTVTVGTDGVVKYHNDGTGTTDTFRYTVRDTQGAVSNEAQVTITIGGANPPPIANNDTSTVATGGMVTFSVVSNDEDPDDNLDPSTVTITSEPTHGTVTVHSDGTVTYTNDGVHVTSDSFQYTVRDKL